MGLRARSMISGGKMTWGSKVVMQSRSFSRVFIFMK